jgi:HEAT repeat protein
LAHNASARVYLGLGRIGPEAATAIPALLELLQDEQVPVRAAAATALGQMGPSAREAVSALTAALHDKEPQVRRHAAQALGEIGREELQHRDAAVRCQSAEVVVRRTFVTSILIDT